MATSFPITHFVASFSRKQNHLRLHETLMRTSGETMTFIAVHYTRILEFAAQGYIIVADHGRANHGIFWMMK